MQNQRLCKTRPVRESVTDIMKQRSAKVQKRLRQLKKISDFGRSECNSQYKHAECLTNEESSVVQLIFATAGHARHVFNGIFSA